MDENTTTDGSTAMERLARELMDKIESSAATSWCRDHGYNVKGTSYTEDKRNARADIERRINEADLEDDRARDVALGDWKEKVAELDALKSAGRVMPEGLSWPRYDDGRPVLLGDEVDGDKVAWVVLNSIKYEICNRDNSCLTTDLYGKPVERPAPKAVGADGVEVKAGETVWLAREHLDKADMSPSDSGFECGLLGVGALDPLSVKSVGKKLDKDGFAFFTEHGAWCPASWLTHEPADSWGRLREDALKTFYAYCGCEGMPCTPCPAKIGDERPCDHYGTGISCTDAIQLDLVARAERLAGVQGE